MSIKEGNTPFVWRYSIGEAQINQVTNCGNSTKSMTFITIEKMSWKLDHIAIVISLITALIITINWLPTYGEVGLQNRGRRRRKSKSSFTPTKRGGRKGFSYAERESFEVVLMQDL